MTEARTLFIDGAWEAAADGRTRTILCPADQREVGVVSEASAVDTERAIAAARRAFDAGEWSVVPAIERAQVLLRAAVLLRERRAEFALAESLDTGKRTYESEIDMDDIANCFEWFGKIGGTDGGRVVEAGPGVAARIVHEPVGVCGLIAPWNYPLLQAAWKIAPALVAGNTFVLKPSELTPHTSILTMQLLADAGVPAGVANLVTGTGAEAGAPLSESRDVDLVSFTGGLATGRVIARSAAETVKKIALELGGKNPNVIFADAVHSDAIGLETVVDNALNAAFLHSGQVCSAGARLVVEASVKDEVVDRLVERARAVRLGGPFDEATETGPLISRAHREKVHGYVQRAVEQGAVLRCGGEFGAGELADGWFYLPTVLDECTRAMECVHDEAFGPTVTVETFTTVDEAVEIANDTEYGLAGAVWTADAGRAELVARRLRHGTVWINEFGPYAPGAEWGGFKASGIGRELGFAGLEEYREAKHIHHNLEPAVTGWFAKEEQ